MLNEDQISEIQKRIEEDIYDQVNNGKQTQALPEGYQACGQFFKIKDRVQRGLHGTSSALKVIAISNNDNLKNSIPFIIRYLKDHSSVESQLLSAQDPKEIINKDEANIIKISESLYSLSFVQSGVGKKTQIVNNLYGKLKQAMVEDKGWGYFTGSQEVQLLPTIFSALALFSNAYTGFENSFNYILNETEEKIQNNNLDLSTYAVLVFALYVLAFHYRPAFNDKAINARYKNAYKKLWESEYRTFNEDIEQNIEYWHEGDHFYIRIPWQLYLLALTSRFSSWNFAKVETQKRLDSIYNHCVNGGGFRYQYSGPYYSVRTHAIIYEILDNIRQNLKRKTLYQVIKFIDQIRNILSHAVTRRIISILSILLGVYIAYRWYDQGKFDLKELGPELLGAILVWLILLGKKN